MTSSTFQQQSEGSSHRAGQGDADNQRNSQTTSELLRASADAKNNAMQLIDSVQSVMGLAQSAVREQLQARPYVTLGAAAGAGYVLGGGLATSMTKTAFRLGTKVAYGYVLREVMKKVGGDSESADNQGGESRSDDFSAQGHASGHDRPIPDEPDAE